jgi:hypothetical protein
MRDIVAPDQELARTNYCTVSLADDAERQETRRF